MASLQSRIPKDARQLVKASLTMSGNVAVHCEVCGQSWQPLLQAYGRLPRGWWKCPQGHTENKGAGQ